MKTNPLTSSFCVQKPCCIASAPLPSPRWAEGTWNLFQDRINEELIKEMTDAMINKGYCDAGNNYIFIDD